MIVYSLVLTLAGWPDSWQGWGWSRSAAVSSDNETLRDLNVDLTSVLVATGALVVAGTLAGLVPARRAAALAPVDALRSQE